MKKIVIVGSGTAGLITAAMMKNYWKDLVDISIIYDASKKNIAVGESTTPIFRLLLAHMGISTQEFLKHLGGKATLKLGIHFKNWIPGKDYFHGFAEVNSDVDTNTSAIYSLPNNKFNGGMLHNHPSTNIPNKPFDDYAYAFHVDTQAFSEFMINGYQNVINFIDDVVEVVDSDGKEIKSLTLRSGKKIEADLFVDASGFNTVLFKHLNPEWIDVSDALPIDRAIPQQVPYNFRDIPSYTCCEATENGWIWQIPIGQRYGTGYLYSSKFTSDDEAREKYNEWLLKNFNVNLETDRVIKYKPGYYDNYYIGNCMAVGLSSGFIEPLEATGIQIIIQQIQEFMTINSTLKNLSYNRVIINKSNRTLYRDIVDFICLHYCTNRTDSEFWRYMTENKTEWTKSFEQKCREEFLDARTCYKEKTFWGLDSFVQVSNGLEMFNKESIKEFLDAKIDGKEIYMQAKATHEYLENEKRRIRRISHKKVLESIISNK